MTLLLATLLWSQIPSQAEVLESAWKKLPERESLMALERAGALSEGLTFFDNPELQLDYQAEDSGAMPAEWEFVVNLPIATPAMRALQKRLSGQYESYNQKHHQFLKWRLKGTLQNLFWDFRQLQVKHRQIEVAMLDSEQQRQWLTELVALGERSADELNQAKQQWVLDQFQYQEVQQELAAKRRQWEQYTGFTEFPATWSSPEIQGQMDAQIEASHPYLIFLNQQLELLEMELEREKKLRVAPQLSGGIKRVESMADDASATAWKIGFSYPLETRPVGTHRDAYVQIGDLKGQIIQVRRALTLRLDQLRAEMDSNQLQLDLLDPMAEEMEAQFALRRQAFREGLITVLEWQQIRQLHRKFKQQLGAARILQAALQAEYSHTAGVMP